MGKKILIVDHSTVLLELEKSIFDRTGAQILTANTGADALKVVQEKKPDIVLLDLVLKDMPGDEVCTQIKAHPATTDIRVLMVTAKGTPEEIEQCRRAGCDDYILKPIRNQELLQKVSELLGVPHRRSMRILVRVETQENFEKNVSFFGVSRDISETGMFIETDRKLNPGSRLTLRFFLPGLEEIIAEGRVVRQEVRGTSKGYGIHFEEIFMHHQELIAKFIASRTR